MKEGRQSTPFFPNVTFFIQELINRFVPENSITFCVDKGLRRLREGR